MKVFKNYRETYEAYKRGEIDGVVVRDIAHAQFTIVLEESMTIENLRTPADHGCNLSEDELLKIYEASADKEEEGFDWQLGGEMYICETEEDLLQIHGLSLEWEAEHEGCANVTDTPMSWDACDYVFGDSASGWGIFLLCTNNAGGNLYYVPESLWEASRFKEHFKMSNATSGCSAEASTDSTSPLN